MQVNLLDFPERLGNIFFLELDMSQIQKTTV